MKALGVNIRALLACTAAFAQSGEDSWRRMQESRKQVMAFLEREAQSITDHAAQEIATRESWEKVRARRLEQMRDMLGLLPWPRRAPLNVRITGKLDRGSYTVEKIAFESLPKIYVTANLYLPRERKGAVPGVIYVCGHSGAQAGAKARYQRHGISFAKNGYAAFILDPIQIAETFALHHGVGWQEMYDWYSRGYTPAGVEVWNAMRAIDYLETRPEVDKARIGITGRSGGAAISWFTGAVDPRVKVAAPIMGISTYAANVRANTQRLHCDCMFALNSWLHDMMHQGALIAPRPLLMGHGSKDDLFPVPGYTEFEQRVGALYAAYGASEAFRNVVVPTAHADSDSLRETAIRWFDRFLMGAAADRKLDMSYTDEPDEAVKVFASGPPADAQNFRVHEIFTTRPPSPPFASRAAWEKRRAELMETLRARVFANVPRPKNVRLKGEELSADGIVPVRALVRPAPKGKTGVPGLLYVASDAEDPRSIGYLLADSTECVRLIVYPRGVGEAPWERSFWRDVMRNAMHVGQTVDSMRLADVLAAAEALRAQPGVDPKRILATGRGVSGALGLYAALLDPEIQQVMLIDPPVTHADGPVFLNILRHTDLPEAAGLLAPRRLSFYARMPGAYEYTRGIYKLYGEDLFRSMHISGVLAGRYHHNFNIGR
ncbi:MAG: acetylxylan esterase [Bryobacteraceae bacterium]